MDHSHEVEQMLRSLEEPSPAHSRHVPELENSSSPFFKSHDRSRNLFGRHGSVPVGVADTQLAAARDPTSCFLYAKELDPDDFDFGDIPLDAFDKELLAQTGPDRRSQAENGQARLTLAPRPTRMERVDRPGLGRAPDPQTPPTKLLGSSSSGFGDSTSPSFVRARQLQARKTMYQPDPAADSIFSPPVAPKQLLGTSHQLALAHAPPMVQGIPLVPTTDLPDRFRSMFKFPMFNAIQSKCFNPVYQSDDNVVISAPTGSGKTVVMELAICRLVVGLKTEQYKVVYQAPTKSLCAERFRDWQAKFSTLGLQCAELTGDTEQSQLRSVQSANIIITTPEKWDSMTRKWKDHKRLLQLVKLFLIDEVHILKDSRGATLEAVVSRMKSVGSGVRFVALSATIPNSEDVAAWLGKDAMTAHLPAYLGKFGEEFRPVKLQKFVYGHDFKGNEFAFDKACEARIPDIIERHGNKKPIMIFCMTRNSCIQTAKYLANIFNAANHQYRLWKGPSAQVRAHDQELRATISSGVAFHHAGLESADRQAVEHGFLNGQISIICCTSTLAVGVNLPCYLVIIKNTMTWGDNGCQEYADLEIMQMLGRAGRPQFETSAVAAILTKHERVHYFEKMVSGVECLESCLHLNLINHLNAEIGLGTVTDLSSAKRWLAGTFLFVRLGRNPDHYKIGESLHDNDVDEWLEHICEKDIKLLQECELIELSPVSGRFKCTAFGDAMARYYVKFETMKILHSLPAKPKISEMLSALAQAAEFREIRLKSGEKTLYKEVNKGVGIKFPIKVDIALPAHKVSLAIQAELGGVDYPSAESFRKLQIQFQLDKNLIIQHINRLIRCTIDCSIEKGDSVAVRHALELARSFGAKVWDTSPLQMKQIGGVGLVAVRKLASAGINSLEMLETTDASRIDAIMSRNPPFGKNLLAKLKDFPKTRVNLKIMGKEINPGKPVKVQFMAEIGFLNEEVPVLYNRNAVFVCFLAETSDGHLIEFRRMAARALQDGHQMLLSADLYHPSQYIICHVSCDEIAGTSRYAELKPNLPASSFPASRPSEASGGHQMSRKASDHKDGRPVRFSSLYEDDDIDDVDLLAAAQEAELTPVDGDGKHSARNSSSRPAKNGKVTAAGSKTRTASQAEPKQPVQLNNGKWACSHNCKDKTNCKHFCCRDGLDKPPKARKTPKVNEEKPNEKESPKQKSVNETGQTTLTLGSRLPGSRKKRDRSIETLDMTESQGRSSQGSSMVPSNRKDKKKLDSLHEKTTPSTSFTPLSRNVPSTYAKGKKPWLSFLSDSSSPERVFPTTTNLSDYDDAFFDDIELPSTQALLAGAKFKQKNQDRPSKSTVQTKPKFFDPYDKDVSDLEAGMVGLEDSLILQSNIGLDMDDWNDPFKPISSPPPKLNGKEKTKASTPKTIASPLKKANHDDSSSATILGDKIPSSDSRLFVTPENASAGPLLFGRAEPNVRSPKRKELSVQDKEEIEWALKLQPLPKKQKREGSRPLSARNNVGQERPQVEGDEKSAALEGGGPVNVEKKENVEKPWWEGDDIDQDFIKEFGPYVNFV